MLPAAVAEICCQMKLKIVKNIKSKLATKYKTNDFVEKQLKHCSWLKNKFNKLWPINYGKTRKRKIGRHKLCKCLRAEFAGICFRKVIAQNGLYDLLNFKIETKFLLKLQIIKKLKSMIVMPL